MSGKIPTYSICNLIGDNYAQEELIVYDLREFIDSNKNITFPHRHDFYQLLYIKNGTGSHIIDFEKYAIGEGNVFFLSPQQVHEWIFDNKTDGILINFDESVFSSFLANADYIKELNMFSGYSKYSLVDFSSNVEELKNAENIFERILSLHRSHHINNLDLIRALLLQLFIVSNSKLDIKEKQGTNGSNYLLFKKFERLIAEHFKTKHMPKDYAELLFVTPNHLNVITNQIAGKSAGEYIRNRILLEAKRLLINSHLSISEIAYELHFEDNSYFSKFFKKHELITPEEFRKNKH